MADYVTLLPCKCGTRPEVSQEPYTRRVAIFCAGCGEVTRYYDTASEAYDAWNEARRNDAVAERDARIAALEAELAAIKARRCETCKHWGSFDNGHYCAHSAVWNPDYPVWTRAEHSCSWYRPRKQPQEAADA